MKKLASALVVLCLLLWLPSVAHSQLKFGFKAYGGVNYLTGGDLTKATQGWSDLWLDFWEGIVDVEGEYLPAHLGMNLGGEFIIQFTPNLGVALGIGQFSASKSSVIELSDASISVDYEWMAKATAMPITLGVIYYPPSQGNMNFFLTGGLGYYIAKVHFTQDFLFFGTFNEDTEASGGGIGFHGGLGLEFNVSPQFAIVAELRGRYAAFSNFEGTYDNMSDEEGKLWAFKDGDYFMIQVYDTVPSWADNDTEAKIDFSGGSFLLGVKINF